MYTLSKAVVLAMLALSTSALTIGHGVQHQGRHHAIARHVAPAAETRSERSPAVPRALSTKNKNKRSRCKPRPSSSSSVVAVSSTILIAQPTTSEKPASSSQAPEPTTSSKAPEPTTSSKAPEPTTSSKAPEPTTSSKTPEPTTSSTPEPEPTSTKAEPTSSKDPEPTPTPTPTPSPTTSKAPATTSQASSGGGDQPPYMTGTQTGQGTFYATGLGACGTTNNDAQDIAAVSHLLFDTFPGYDGKNPNNNPMCGRKVIASRNGKSVTVALTDRCEGCAITDLDFSPHAFNLLADPSEGRVPITWVWA